MLDRIVSLALIICFLPLPGVNAAEVWQSLFLVSRDADRSSENLDEAESSERLEDRILESPNSFDSDIFVFCEVENEVREKESKSGEDDTVGIPVRLATTIRNRFASASYRLGYGDPASGFDHIASRYHVLRC